MFKLSLAMFLTSCVLHKDIKKSMLEASESPCLDGTIVNIYQAGCKALFIGETKDSLSLKIRCSYSPNDSVWTRASFYAMPHNAEPKYSNWFLFCEDRYIQMFSTPYGISLNNE